MPELKEWTAGLNLKQDAWKLSPNALTSAINVVVRNGDLEPLAGLGSAETTGLGAGTWAWIWKLGSTWLGSTTARYAVQWQNSYVAYVTVGSSPPQITNGTSTSNLGITGPTAVVTTGLGAAGNITGTNLSWVVTYVDALGQESSPSPAQAALLSPARQQVSLSTIPTSGSYTRKVYRTDASGTYRYVATLNSSDTTYTDNTAVEALGDPLLTESATAAPNLTGLAVGTYDTMLGGWINSGSSNSFYTSNPGSPWVWSLGGINLPDPIQAAFGTDRGFVVLTSAKPYLVTGDSINTRAQQPFNNTYGCTAAFTVCETDYGWVYWSAKGLILVTPSNEFVELMVDHYTQSLIDAFSTTGMKATFYQGEVLLFHSGGCLRCDLRHFQDRGPVFTTSDQTADAVWRAQDGTVYIGVGNGVYKWATGASRTMTIRTGEFAAQTPNGAVHLREARARTDGSGNTYQWYAAGTSTGTAKTATRVNGIDRARATRGIWDRGALQIVGTNTVREIYLEATEVNSGS